MKGYDTCPACGGPKRNVSRTCIHCRPHVPLADRFWAKVDKNGPTTRPELGPCWLWTGATNGRYGIIGVNSKRGHNYAHRVAFVLVYGQIPRGLLVLHSCDTPLCVKGTHLFSGSHGDNNRDAIQKGRWRAPKKVDDQAALKLVESGSTMQQAAALLGVSAATVCRAAGRARSATLVA